MILILWNAYCPLYIYCRTTELLTQMEIGFDLSKMMAGIGLFLLGMGFLEEALRKLAGRAFKIFLRKQTSNKLKAVAGGAIVTGVLQSSSVVNLMVLAFVGAGVLTMQNALAVILGANIGTTLTSWIVATLGFKLNIEGLAFPIVGIFGVAMVVVRREGTAYQWSKFLLGFGLLFVGLSFMKTGFESMVNQFDFGQLANYPLALFVIAGFVLTTLIQSSSATVAITLTALHSDAITLLAAMAMVLGSEVGTTIKLILAALNGIAAKKRVALGNFFYNTFMIIIILIAIRPIHYLITDLIGLHDSLVALVVFQSGINVAGVILFFPFLSWFGTYLNSLFKQNDESTKYIKAIPAHVGDDLALEALAKETRRLLFLVINYVMHSFGTRPDTVIEEIDQAYWEKTIDEKYDFLKLLHGEIYAYAIRLNKEALNDEERELIERLTSSVRNSMFAAKSIKDSEHDIDQFKNSSNNAKYHYYQQKRMAVKAFYDRLISLLMKPVLPNGFEEMVEMYNNVHKGYTEELSNLYKTGADTSLNEVEISTLINFNRELHSSHKAIVWAMKDYLLDKEQARYFAELPGFIR